MKKCITGHLNLIFKGRRELRNNSTYAETLLWGYLKTKPYGIKFRRQHPYSIYILDFYCHSLKLVIELDGSIHNQPDIKINDRIKQRQIESDGLIVVRFTNDLVEKSFEEVRKQIEKFIVKSTDEQQR